MIELKPCPFCGCGEGGLYFVTKEERGFESIGIFCDSCKQTVFLEDNDWEGDTAESRTRAVEAWNRRAGEQNADG